MRRLALLALTGSLHLLLNTQCHNRTVAISAPSFGSTSLHVDLYWSMRVCSPWSCALFFASAYGLGAYAPHGC
eukprot:6568801-Pyramimonas_sp.AAC.1